VGIDISKGTTLTGVHGSRIVTHHPDTGNPLTDIPVPHWDTMLAIAARASDMTNLGYLGVDLIIDRERGPLLLELNARPGLQIQIANRMGLRSRLELIDHASKDIFDGDPSSWARKRFRPPRPNNGLYRILLLPIIAKKRHLCRCEEIQLEIITSSSPSPLFKTLM
jgi:hypothetical protein